MQKQLLANVRYQIKKGKREEFYVKVKEQEIDKASKEEPGHYQKL